MHGRHEEGSEHHVEFLIGNQTGHLIEIVEKYITLMQTVRESQHIIQRASRRFDGRVVRVLHLQNTIPPQRHKVRRPTVSVSTAGK